jgi:hypothetical protein
LVRVVFLSSLIARRERARSRSCRRSPMSQPASQCKMVKVTRHWDPLRPQLVSAARQRCQDAMRRTPGPLPPLCAPTAADVSNTSMASALAREPDTQPPQSGEGLSSSCLPLTSSCPRAGSSSSVAGSAVTMCSRFTFSTQMRLPQPSSGQSLRPIASR